MATLREVLLTEEKTPDVLRDCSRLLDSEVSRKKGVSGFAIKAAYKAVKTIKSGFIDGVLADLVPEFCDALNDIHEASLEKDGTFGDYMKSHQNEVTSALLTVTDGKADRSTNRLVERSYGKLRGKAESNVKEAIPGLARVMDQHYPS